MSATHRAAGLAYIPEDRAAVGTALRGERRRQSRDGLPSQRRRSPRGPCIDPSAFAERARALIRRFGIRIASERAARSGRYRAAICRRSWWRASSRTKRRSLIAEQPTRGVDVGATEFIHEQLVAERDRGRAVLLVSAELARDPRRCRDRVLVMYEGRILADVPAGKADEQMSDLLMAGRRRGSRHERFLQRAEARRRPPAHSAGGARDRASPSSVGGRARPGLRRTIRSSAYARSSAARSRLEQPAEHAQLGRRRWWE